MIWSHRKPLHTREREVNEHTKIEENPPRRREVRKLMGPNLILILNRAGWLVVVWLAINSTVQRLTNLKPRHLKQPAAPSRRDVTEFEATVAGSRQHCLGLLTTLAGQVDCTNSTAVPNAKRKQRRKKEEDEEEEATSPNSVGRSAQNPTDLSQSVHRSITLYLEATHSQISGFKHDPWHGAQLTKPIARCPDTL